MEVTIFVTHLQSDIPSLLLCVFLRSKSPGPANTQEGILQGHEDQKVGSLGDIVEAARCRLP